MNERESVSQQIADKYPLWVIELALSLKEGELLAGQTV
jgi:hypothetical protein